ncbi:MAG: glycosyltransferase family 2 protein [Flavobacteriales bacterium]|nr:glycosyltransferase family 2 protein [Flavobacteriales bacterium]
MPLFSVVIPLYNKQDYITNAVKSVLRQTVTDIEIIIVNDASTDNSLSRIEQLTDSRIQIIHHTKNKGLSAARNTGIKKATSDFIAFLDADDTWENSFLFTIQKLISKYPQAGIFGTNYQEQYPNGHQQEPQKNIPTNFKDGIISNFFESNLHQPIYNYSSVCFRATVFEQVGYFDESINYAEDIDFNIRVNLKFELAYSQKPLSVFFTNTQNQITNTALGNKTIPDFNKYQQTNSDNLSLIKYLDFQRYILAKHYKTEGNKLFFEKKIAEINLANLNRKQRFLLLAPRWLTILVQRLKALLLKSLGIKLSTYS